jgi:hypothetical protein
VIGSAAHRIDTPARAADGVSMELEFDGDAMRRRQA